MLHTIHAKKTLKSSRSSKRTLKLSAIWAVSYGISCHLIWFQGTSAYNYDGTPETDYEIKVEAVELDDKTEREQNIFMNSPSAMGEFDMEKIKVLVPEIDYKAAGLSEADMNIYGISVMQDEISSELSDTLGDFEEIQRPFEERKAAVKEMKEQIRQQAEQKAEDIESYVMLNFKSYRAKSSFMLRFGFRPDDKIIPGEMFSDMVERVE